MTPAAFERYLTYAVSNYAEVNVISGRWKKEDALALSKAAFDEHLPQGLNTPGHHLFEIKDNGSVTVGDLWVGVVNKNGIRSAFIFEIRILPEFRRQGHGTRAMKALEPIVRSFGLSDIGLHVFGYNHEAQALYRKLGYSVLDLNMVKRLGAEGQAEVGI